MNSLLNSDVVKPPEPGMKCYGSTVELGGSILPVTKKGVMMKRPGWVWMYSKFLLANSTPKSVTFNMNKTVRGLIMLVLTLWALYSGPHLYTVSEWQQIHGSKSIYQSHAACEMLGGIMAGKYPEVCSSVEQTYAACQDPTVQLFMSEACK